MDSRWCDVQKEKKALSKGEAEKLDKDTKKKTEKWRVKSRKKFPLLNFGVAVLLKGRFVLFVGFFTMIGVM
jgi:hypothetical protein